MERIVLLLSGPRADSVPDWTKTLLAFGLLLCGLFLYLWRQRRLLYVTVNCWFCNQNSASLRGLENAWNCPHCLQYNGFDKNGDYNKPIHAQYNKLLNCVVSGAKPQQWFKSQVTLCKNCNSNEKKKFKQLASFTPMDENKFDEEVKLYKGLLEQMYRLCTPCQSAVDAHLKQQNYQLRVLMLDYHLKRTERNKYNMQNLGRTYSIRCPLHVTIVRFLAFLSCVFLLSVAVLGSRDPLSCPITQPEEHTNIVPGPTMHRSFWEEVLDSTLRETFQHLNVIWLFGQTHQKDVVLLGLLTSVFAIFSAGRVRLRRIDILSSSLWLLLFCFYQLAEPHTWLDTIRLGTTILCCVIGLLSSVITRTVRRQQRIPP